jgi:hypothetical protein
MVREKDNLMGSTSASAIHDAVRTITATQRNGRAISRRCPERETAAAGIRITGKISEMEIQRSIVIGASPARESLSASVNARG